MNPYIDSLECLLALAALGFILYGPWQWVCTDYGRQILFEKREALFDFAHEGKIEFDSVEYQTLRLSLETLIRFSHEITVMKFLFLAWALKLQSKEEAKSNRIDQAINKITQRDTRHEIHRLFREAHLVVVSMMIFKSPLLIIILISLSPFVVFGILAATALGAIHRWWSAIGHFAQIIGNTVQAEANLSPCAEFA